MLSFASVEQRASRVVDPVAKLRFLRTESGRRRKRIGRLAFAGKVSGVACALLFLQQQGRVKAVEPSPAPHPQAVMRMAAAQTLGPVWLVEESGARRVYSNGLIVRADYATEAGARRYRTYSRAGLRASEPKSVPAGIVFHTTESLIVPLEPGLNQELRRSREDVLAHVRRDRLYHFVIDRFGQVYGVVPEDQVAFHAGHSVWADGERVYVDLNESFLGVSFEAQTDSEFKPTPAQVHAGRLVTEMLRSRYAIPRENCVTHAQVSVNPDNMRLGYHTDWGSDFPFRALELGDGYSVPVAAVGVFGFAYDDGFLAAIGGRAWRGLAAADEEMERAAAARGVPPAVYRKGLQEQYRQLRRHRNERAG